MYSWTFMTYSQFGGSIATLKSLLQSFPSQSTYFRSTYNYLFNWVWPSEQLFADVLFAGSSLVALANCYCFTDHRSLITKMHTQKRSPRTGSFREWNGLRESYALFHSEFLSLRAPCSPKAISPVMENLLFYLFF